MRMLYTTSSGVQIGLMYQPAMPTIYGHALTLQTALLDKRTTTKPNALMALSGRIWGWL